LINIDAATWIPTTLSRYHQTKMNIVCGDGFWSSEVYSMIVYLWLFRSGSIPSKSYISAIRRCIHLIELTSGSSYYFAVVLAHTM